MSGTKETRKPAAYCRIIDYINHSGAEGERLHDVLQFTCQLGLLSNLRGKSGITLMWPTSKTLDEIENAIYRGDGASIYAAQQRLRAHVLSDVFNEKTPFATGKPAVNCLTPSRSNVVKKATGKTVEFEKSANGEPAVATLDEAFKVVTDPANPRVLLAVWRMKSGEMPMDGPEMAAPRPLKKKAGGNPPPPDAASGELRRRILKEVETTYKQHHGTGSAYLDTYASLFTFLKGRHDDVLFDVVLPLTSFTPIDLYLILEPYQTGAPLIDDHIIRTWWDDHRGVANDKHAVRREVIGLLENGHPSAPAGLYSAPARVEMLKKVNAARAAILTAVCADFKNCVSVFTQKYGELMGASGDFWPASIRHLYATADTKLAHDDLRYVTKMTFDKLATAWSDIGFEQARNNIEQCLSGSAPKAPLVHAGTVKYTINGGRELQPQIYMLAASDYLWFFPHTMVDSDAASKGMRLLELPPEVGRKGLWRDLVYAMCRPSCAPSSLDADSAHNAAHAELYNALRDVISEANGATEEAEKVLAKYRR